MSHRFKHWKAALLPAALLLCSERSAEADERPREKVRLVYTRAEGASQCPDSADLQRAVAERLGYNPFSESAEAAISVAIAPLEGGLVADVARQNSTGTSVGSRRIESKTTACDALAGAVALAVSIAVDPAAALGVPTPPKKEETAPPVEKKEPDKKVALTGDGKTGPTAVNPPNAANSGQEPPDPNAFDRKTLRFVVGVGVLGSLGVSPNVGFGLLAHAELRRSIWSVGLEGRLDVPIPAGLDGGGNLVTTLVTGRATPCLHMNVLFGCGLVSVGALFGATDGVANPAKQTTPFASAGLRFGANWAVLPRLYLRGQLDVEATLTRTTFEVDNLPVWTTLPVNGALSFLALVPFS